MRNNNYQLSRLKHEILKPANRNKHWSLNKAEREFVVYNLGLKVEPSLYRIYTKNIKNIKQITNLLLRDVHFKRKRMDSFVHELSPKDQEILKSYNVKFQPIKYKITHR